MAEVIDIFTLKIDLDAAIKSTADLADETARLKIVNDSYARSTEASTEEQVKAKAAYDASNSELKENQRELTKLIKIKDVEIKTVQQGRNALAVLNKEWAKQASLYGANSKQANALADKTSQLRDRLKELEKGVGDNTRNVGNYSEGFKEALGSSNLFTRGMANLTQALKVGAPVVKAVKTEAAAAAATFKTAAAGTETMTRAQKAATITTNLMSGALKIFKLALISTGVGALVVALGSLIAYFTNTQKGADQVSKVMAGLGAVVDVLIDRISMFGGALVKLFSGDFSGAFEDMEAAISGVGDEIERELTLAVELEQSLQKVNDAEIALIGTQEERKLKAKELELAAKDELKTAEERAELLKQAQDLQAAIFDDEIAIATERARISQAQIDLGESTREQIRENAQLQAEVTKLETTAIERQITLESEKQSLQKRARDEAKATRKAELDNAKKITDQALKDNKTRLQIFIEQNEGRTKVLADGLAFFEERMLAELALEDERHEAGKTNAVEYELALLQIKNKSLEDQAALAAEFADKEKEIAAAKLEAKLEAEKTETERLQEKGLIEFEAEQETRVAQGEWHFNILRDDLAKQQEAEIAAAQKVGADTTKIEAKFAAYSKQIKQDEQNAKLSAVANTFGAVADLLGKETIAGKAAAVAQATIQTYLGAQQAYTSLSSIPVIGPALGAVAAGVAVAAGLLNIRKIIATPKPEIPKAEKGALFNIGGSRHSAGGTKFTGEDGTQFEAERGELIGVMNRRAAANFMAFNNQFGPAGQKGNYFADGGIVARGVSGIPSVPGTQNAGLNVDELAFKIAEANQALPAPVVLVEDINTGQDNLAEVEQGASV